ncbi:hypothetical protein A3I95_02385 [Candidatus Nomurabacteria bacterium RIFCSPLOWO2_02_FULL_44_12]|uniref:Uncharacterized protein n=1 Tax=Candidatus Nomurabacteria bacterium RIFCSPLOWO2_12_FULL_44_11 TaxID=1801796 RepID=A0A1F6Y5U3_9BACT|nr:MAG: hypothetical protein A3E95_03075 [Candidatus Nomurabacteria bacterium RIFCSPHIGHO2_12_FULL_44_22b]OGJ01728.1 MAG: hypothetical protein A3G53_02055 [Candidatus Nomurabacteria bacterium RIFCSPLOWO2_12_FULL_44_11]OGJ08524.1 MAG: hypothetical protein A3I95_02385 [Candidatus Nomurabacteria bacterium RIFCSPLOWO2_02_FULL_44_12]
MQIILSLVWYMVAVLPYLIFMEGVNWAKKFLAKRGLEWDWLYILLIVLCVLLIGLWLAGYR